MQRIATDKAPAAIGPYSQGIKAGGLVFTSGQIPLDPGTGAKAGDGIEAQTERVILNLKAVLEAAGSSLDRVVKTTVFLRHMGDFAAMNAVYTRFFPGRTCPPARPSRSGAFPWTRWSRSRPSGKYKAAKKSVR
jgi:2-iminobutanoate/2-iminopropanoate deaminase